MWYMIYDMWYNIYIYVYTHDIAIVVGAHMAPYSILCPFTTSTEVYGYPVPYTFG